MSETVGLVVPALTEGGGVPAVARFLTEVLEESGGFGVRHFSVPMSAGDDASVRLVDPSSWWDKPGVVSGEWEGREFRHFGARLPELEFQRYRPRPVLTECLEECDLIQVVAGSPAWALVASDVNRPVALQIATLAEVERRQRFRSEGGLITIWRRVMTRITARLDRKGTRVADRIFVENPWMQRTVESWTNPERVVLAPPGVDTDLFHPGETSFADRKSKYLFSVARFDDARKRTTDLFEAYARVSRCFENPPELVLAGASGPRPEAWRRAEKLGIRDRVRFYENLPTEELASLYRGALIFLLASAEEGLGLVFLEAQASGVPVVATRTNGSETAVEEGVTGMLSPVKDPDAFAHIVIELLSDDQRRWRMGRAARRRAEEHFSHGAAARRFIREYRRLTDRAGQ